MDNPYKSPKSDVSVDSSETSRSIWWKLYFFIITLLSALGIFSFLAAEGVGIVEYIYLVLLVIGTAGLFGFVFGKKIFFPKFWLPFLILYILAGVFYEELSDIDMRQGMTDSEYYISMVIGLIISLPAYIGLYLYSNPNKYPWNKS